MSLTKDSPNPGVAEVARPGGGAAPTSFVADLGQVLQQNIRDYGMWIALFVIMAIFTVTTKGLFISPRNISNLLNQTGYIAVLAVGVTLVIIIRHIDLSIGFLSGFIGAIVAIGLTTWKLRPLSPRWAAGWLTVERCCW